MEEQFDILGTLDDTSLEVRITIVDNDIKASFVCARIRKACGKFPVAVFYVKHLCKNGNNQVGSTVVSKCPKEVLLIATPEDGNLYLFRIDILKPFPPYLIDLLKDKGIVKISVFPEYNALNLQQDYNVNVNTTLDIRLLFPSNVHLPTLVKQTLNLTHGNLKFAKETNQVCVQPYYHGMRSAFLDMEMFKHWISVKFNNHELHSIWPSIKSKIVQYYNVPFDSSACSALKPPPSAFSFADTIRKEEFKFLKSRIASTSVETVFKEGKDLEGQTAEVLKPNSGNDVSRQDCETTTTSTMEKHVPKQENVTSAQAETVVEPNDIPSKQDIVVQQSAAFKAVDVSSDAKPPAAFSVEKIAFEQLTLNNNTEASSTSTLPPLKTDAANVDASSSIMPEINCVKDIAAKLRLLNSKLRERNTSKSDTSGAAPGKRYVLISREVNAKKTLPNNEPPADEIQSVDTVTVNGDIKKNWISVNKDVATVKETLPKHGLPNEVYKFGKFMKQSVGNSAGKSIERPTVSANGDRLSANKSVAINELRAKNTTQVVQSPYCGPSSPKPCISAGEKTTFISSSKSAADVVSSTKTDNPAERIIHKRFVTESGRSIILSSNSSKRIAPKQSLANNNLSAGVSSKLMPSTSKPERSPVQSINNGASKPMKMTSISASIDEVFMLMKAIPPTSAPFKLKSDFATAISKELKGADETGRKSEAKATFMTEKETDATMSCVFPDEKVATNSSLSVIENHSTYTSSKWVKSAMDKKLTVEKCVSVTEEILSADNSSMVKASSLQSAQSELFKDKVTSSATAVTSNQPYTTTTSNKNKTIFSKFKEWWNRSIIPAEQTLQNNELLNRAVTSTDTVTSPALTVTSPQLSLGSSENTPVAFQSNNQNKSIKEAVTSTGTDTSKAPVVTTSQLSLDSSDNSSVSTQSNKQIKFLKGAVTSTDTVTSQAPVVTSRKLSLDSSENTPVSVNTNHQIKSSETPTPKRSLDPSVSVESKHQMKAPEVATTVTSSLRTPVQSHSLVKNSDNLTSTSTVKSVPKSGETGSSTSTVITKATTVTSSLRTPVQSHSLVPNSDNPTSTVKSVPKSGETGSSTSTTTTKVTTVISSQQSPVQSHSLVQNSDNAKVSSLTSTVKSVQKSNNSEGSVQSNQKKGASSGTGSSTSVVTTKATSLEPTKLPLDSCDNATLSSLTSTVQSVKKSNNAERSFQTDQKKGVSGGTGSSTSTVKTKATAVTSSRHTPKSTTPNVKSMQKSNNTEGSVQSNQKIGASSGMGSSTNTVTTKATAVTSSQHTPKSNNTTSTVKSVQTSNKTDGSVQSNYKKENSGGTGSSTSTITTKATSQAPAKLPLDYSDNATVSSLASAVKSVQKSNNAEGSAQSNYKKGASDGTGSSTSTVTTKVTAVTSSQHTPKSNNTTSTVKSVQTSNKTDGSVQNNYKMGASSGTGSSTSTSTTKSTSETPTKLPPDSCDNATVSSRTSTVKSVKKSNNKEGSVQSNHKKGDSGGMGSSTITISTKGTSETPTKLPLDSSDNAKVCSPTSTVKSVKKSNNAEELVQSNYKIGASSGTGSSTSTVSTKATTVKSITSTQQSTVQRNFLVQNEAKYWYPPTLYPNNGSYSYQPKLISPVNFACFPPPPDYLNIWLGNIKVPKSVVPVVSAAETVRSTPYNYLYPALTDSSKPTEQKAVVQNLPPVRPFVAQQQYVAENRSQISPLILQKALGAIKQTLKKNEDEHDKDWSPTVRSCVTQQQSAAKNRSQISPLILQKDLGDRQETDKILPSLPSVVHRKTNQNQTPIRPFVPKQQSAAEDQSLISPLIPQKDLGVHGKTGQDLPPFVPEQQSANENRSSISPLISQEDLEAIRRSPIKAPLADSSMLSKIRAPEAVDQTLPSLPSLVNSNTDQNQTPVLPFVPKEQSPAEISPLIPRKELGAIRRTLKKKKDELEQDRPPRVCVVCGSTLELVKKTIVPQQMWIIFPEELKTDNTLLVCRKCDRKTAQYYQKLLHTLHYIAGLPVHSNFADAVDKQRIVAIEEGCVRNETVLHEFLRRTSNWKVAVREETPPGEAVRELFMANDIHLSELRRLWRRAFIEAMRPKYLPPKWAEC